MGLRATDNAALALAMFKHLRSGDGSIVFDETVHGYSARPANPLMLMFRFPFVVATLQGLIALALLLWASLARFGSPQTAPPPLSAGRGGLLQNMAKLIELAGHQQEMVARYVQETVRDAGTPAACPARPWRGGAGRLARPRRQRPRRERRLRCAHPQGRASSANAAAKGARWYGSRAMLTDGSRRYSMDVQDIRAIADGVRGEVRKAVVGQDGVIELMITSLLIGGHILLEGVPGTAKTLITRAFAAALRLQFGRIQFTPDLMPGDVLGTNLFNFQTNAFLLTKGPIFTQLLLADEINRTPPKTQAALLQAMNERAVTIDGKDYPLGDEFMVVATQNPIEQQGTYPLPEAQLDRFLFKIIIDHPSRDEEREIVRRHGHRSAMPRLEDFGLKTVADAATLAMIRAAVVGISLSPELIDYIVDVVRATREHSSLEFGASSRAANMLAAAVARLRGAAGPRFRDPGRREGACAPGAAPSPDHVAERGDRGADHRPHPARDPRPDAGAAMTRPTGRTVMLFACGIPLALFVVIYEPGLWVLSFNYAALVLLAAGTDRLLAFPPRLLDVQDRGARQAPYRRARRHHGHRSCGAVAARHPLRGDRGPARRGRARRARGRRAQARTARPGSPLPWCRGGADR